MNSKKAFYFIVSLLLTGGIALAQQSAPPATPPMADTPGEPPPEFSLFVGGGSFLGVYAEDINKENMTRYGMPEPRGVGITQVIKDSPAEKAGLKKDDVIVRFEGDSVTSVRKLNRLVSEVAPDQTVKLNISRGGGEQEVAVTIGKRNEAMNTFGHLQGLEGLKGLEELKGLDKLKEFHGVMPPDAQVWKWEGQEPGKDGMVFAFGNHRQIGVRTMELTKQLADYFGIADGNGVLVTSVSDNSPAAKAGLKAGDIITSIDGEKVEAAGDLARGINKNKDGEVTLDVVRDRKKRTIKVTPEKTQNQLIRPGRVANQREIREQIRDAIRQGAANGRVVIPRIELPTLPAVDISMPAIELPVIPEIRVTIPNAPRVRVIKNPPQPI